MRSDKSMPRTYSMTMNGDGSPGSVVSRKLSGDHGVPVTASHGDDVVAVPVGGPSDSDGSSSTTGSSVASSTA